MAQEEACKKAAHIKEFLPDTTSAAPEGQVEFKTDNQDLFQFSLEQADEAGWRVLMSTWDLHADPAMNQGNVMTEYEKKFSAKGNPICKMIAGR